MSKRASQPWQLVGLSSDWPRAERPRPPDPRAIAGGALTITEISDAGSVPTIRLENSGNKPILILNGEELMGAKQNRVVNLTILAPAGQALDIPPPPKRLSKPFLRRILAWEVQARASGGLSPALEATLDRVADGKHRAARPKLRPGGRLVREWNGVSHVVDVAEDGYHWRSTRFRSLSAIAREITGAHWSGPRFFGLKRGSSR